MTTSTTPESVPLSVFPSPLARLLLCGGAELPPAYGPLTDPDGDGPPFILWHGEPRGPIAMSPFRHMFMPLQLPELWSLPLNASSPWPLRLAHVAAWMLRWRSAPVDVELTATGLYLQSREGSSRWNPHTGKCLPDQTDASLEPDLPTLPNHLAKVRYPVAALALALFDLPELRARVEGAP